MRWLDGITDSMDVFEPALGDGEGQETWPAAAYGVKKSDPA